MTMKSPFRASVLARLASLPTGNIPVVTLGLIVTLILAYSFETRFALGDRVNSDASAATLLALGALNGPVIAHKGEWYRGAVAPLLSANPFQLLMFIASLLVIGPALERRIGPRTFFVLLTVCMLCSSVFSLITNASFMILAGLGGTLLGLIVAAFIQLHRLKGVERARLQTRGLYALIPVAVDFCVTTFIHRHMDFGAYLGAGLGAAVVSGTLLLIWPVGVKAPPLRRTSTVLVLLGGGLFLFSAGSVALRYEDYKPLGLLIPQSEIAPTVSGENEQSAELVARYPHDPRGHQYRARQLLEEKNIEGYARELKAVLREGPEYDYILGTDYLTQTRINLASLYRATNRRAEARAVAAPICNNKSTDMHDVMVLAQMARLHLCGDPGEGGPSLGSVPTVK
jgi:rhomboid protease GluP